MTDLDNLAAQLGYYLDGVHPHPAGGFAAVLVDSDESELVFRGDSVEGAVAEAVARLSALADRRDA